MKKLLFLSILILSIPAFSQNSEIKPYVDYLKKIEKKSAKDYILQQFQDHDIVILCERNHGDLSQYELIKEILNDEYFKKNVKNVFTEIGVINLYPEINIFLKTKGLDSIYVERKLNEFQRKASFWATWDNYNYHYLLRTIYDLNNNSENQISYFPSDVEFDWEKVKTSEEYTREQDFEIEPRDSLMAYNIINQYEKFKSKKNKKALIIMNYRHAFKIHTESDGLLNKNTTKYLFDYFGKRATNILISPIIFKKQYKDYAYSLIQNGKWDASFKYLDIENVGFDFSNNVFSKDNLDMWPNHVIYTYENAFDGFVFYRPIEEQKLVLGFPGLIPKDFEEEFMRRFEINQKYNENTSLLKKLENIEFRQAVIKELNTKRVKNHPNLDVLIETRDKYLND
ncbi:MAG: hypothetical protein CVT95_10985 [Bacteroidetes bacterium HGW-Bacteroidetes-12]|nr:MAG: hypothetical protein CVT95_10985 [Bacteroidetes bacterium HGW-Bacteroidetes-12]